MKLLHLSDLHIGKRLHEVSFLDDQRYILSQILTIIENESPDAVLIAGDVYDKSIPAAEAVTLFDEFLTHLADKKTQVFIISGNHDSAERLSFGSRIMDMTGIHISPVYDKDSVKPFVLEDGFGKCNIYMLPFIKPANVRRFFEDTEIESYTDAVKCAVDAMNVSTNERNVLITHQFVTGGERSDSEEVSVGGTDNVDAAVFDGFDYVALGHLHGPQSIGRETVRYCGTPLKYSFSEEKHTKSVTIVEMKEKGSTSVRTVSLVPMRELVTIKGKYMDIVDSRFRENLNADDYYRVILTDEEDVPEAASRLRAVYKNLLELSIDNSRTRSLASVGDSGDAQTKSEIQLFEELFAKQNGKEMSEEQKALAMAIIEEVLEGEI